MKTLSRLIRWDLTVQARYQILTALFAVMIVYLLLFWLVPGIRYDELLITLIFSDPALLGLTFIGALVLFEKGENTLDALVLTPIRDWQYIWSKALSLTLSATIAGVILAGVGHGWNYNYPVFITGLFLTSVFFILIGFVMVARVSSLNEYIIRLALLMIPVSLPLLNLFGLTDYLLWYLMPTQASLLLFQFSLGMEVLPWQMVYAYAYLLLAILMAYGLARRAYHRNIIH